jgi:hypothetical protein
MSNDKAPELSEEEQDRLDNELADRVLAENPKTVAWEDVKRDLGLDKESEK